MHLVDRLPRATSEAGPVGDGGRVGAERVGAKCEVQEGSVARRRECMCVFLLLWLLLLIDMFVE